MERAFRRVDRNLEFCRILAWRKLDHHAKIRKRDDKIVKHIGVLEAKVRKLVAIEAFRQIVNYGNRKVRFSSRNI